LEDLALRKLKGLLSALLCAAPFVLVFHGCQFVFPHQGPPNLPSPPPPPPSGTAGLFCDVEATRRCATEADLREGVRISEPFREGFWISRSSRIGLDDSQEARIACSGRPQAIVFVDAFPNGSPVCVDPGVVEANPESVRNTCIEWCDSRQLIDGNGDVFFCRSITFPSNGAGHPFPGACTEAGTLRGDFKDPRKPTIDVVWTGFEGAAQTGDVLSKTVLTDAWGDSGAESAQQLASGDGSVRVTASDTLTFRIFGLGRAPSPGNPFDDPTNSFDDIEFGLLLTNTGTLLVLESGAPPMGLNVGTYVTGDVLEVGVFQGVVEYRKNARLLHRSIPPPPSVYPLRAEAALFNASATLTGARASF
jgi:hypothetical protein